MKNLNVKIKNLVNNIYSLTPKARALEGERKRLMLKRRICSFI